VCYPINQSFFVALVFVHFGPFDAVFKHFLNVFTYTKVFYWDLCSCVWHQVHSNDNKLQMKRTETWLNQGRRLQERPLLVRLAQPVFPNNTSQVQLGVTIIFGSNPNPHELHRHYNIRSVSPSWFFRAYCHVYSEYVFFCKL